MRLHSPEKFGPTLSMRQSHTGNTRKASPGYIGISPRSFPLGWILVVLCTIQTTAAGATDGAVQPHDSFDLVAKPFLSQHCVRCHSEEEISSGVRVDHLDGAFEERHFRLWEHLRNQIRDRAMPPEEEPQPGDSERRNMVEWIEQELQKARLRPTPRNGGARRLTVAQYRNTLRDLLLIEDNITDILPPDAVSRDGFVNNQETLSLSPLLLEAYFEIAEKALDCALIKKDAKPTIQRFCVELGSDINREPCPDNLILGANSHLLNNQDFRVTETPPEKPFDFDMFRMQTKYRFIEGYEGNATVRGWREFNSIYHSVFACMRGSEGYPKGVAYSTVRDGLLLRPAIPSIEEFQVESTYGPRANFKISLRELPDHGKFRITVRAAKYNDGLLLDAGTTIAANEVDSIVCRELKHPVRVLIPEDGIYQIDAFSADEDRPSKAVHLSVIVDDRHFTGILQHPPFLALRLSKGSIRFSCNTEGSVLDRIVLSPLAESHSVTTQFRAFEQRSPRVGVHLGLRRDCGSTLNPVGNPQTVSSTSPADFVFTGAIRNFPSPDVEADNVNYLAGIREIGIRSEYTDGRDMPRLLIQSVEFEGPYYESWPPQSHQNILPTPEELTPEDRVEDPSSRARRIIASFANRAFRRPASSKETDGLMQIFEDGMKSGLSFTDSVRQALTVVLTSPQFLFLIEESNSPEPEPLDDYELASKLSYFLWNGPPDDELLRLAASSSLQTHLPVQTDRLIDDSRFEQFASQFASQWLALDKFDVLEPDRTRFPGLTREVRLQLKEEPIQFLQYLVQHNLPLTDLIDSGYILANEITASYYGVADQTESGFAFIKVPRPDDRQGGLFGHAAIMAGLSDGRESNPVKRGAWFARKIIAEPPNDPPPNVPSLDETLEHLNLRERLERHRNQPGCVQCHLTIDPWGIPFEEFDAGGLPRTSPIDAASTLPDKTKVSGIKELKRYLAEDRLEQLAFSVLRHLATYAAGRTLSYRDSEQLRKSSSILKANGYRLRDMIHHVVNSPLFLEK